MNEKEMFSWGFGGGLTLVIGSVVALFVRKVLPLITSFLAAKTAEKDASAELASAAESLAKVSQTTSAAHSTEYQALAERKAQADALILKLEKELAQKNAELRKIKSVEKAVLMQERDEMKKKVAELEAEIERLQKELAAAKALIEKHEQNRTDIISAD
jgi:uncharacterized protein involved in exopolysaccharide biosynthesis